MKQSKKIASRRSANDNAPAPAGAKNMVHGQDTSHLYVQDAKKHEPEKMAPSRARGTWKPTCIYTDLSQKLPVLPEEIALIRGYMGDLVGRILANDNEPI
jgi:hypothetical protein